MSIYCCSDIHGIYSIWKQIKEYLKSDDTLYFLGDAADRGKDGWKIIKELFADERVIYLKGNHEDMLADAMIGQKIFCFNNGGGQTYEDWKNDGKDMSWYKKLKKLPTHIEIINKNNQEILLSHSGYDIGESMHWGDEYFWNREHLLSRYWYGDKNQIMIHGHTICPYLKRYLYDNFPKNYNYASPVPITYCENHKIDLDLGTALSGKCALIDLDSFEVIYFYDNEVEEKYSKQLTKYDIEDYWGI